jgi:choline-sulfatase
MPTSRSSTPARKPRALAALLAMALAGACSPDPGPADTVAGAGAPPGDASAAVPAGAPAPRVPLPAGELPNIIVYLVDTLRADRLHLHGNERDTSPALDQLAAQAAVFEQASSQAPWTLPSVTSLFTGTYPTTHGIVSNFDRLGAQAETLVEYMQARGYHTVGFVTNTLGGKGGGLDQGYDEFHEQQSVNDLTPEQIAAGALSLQPLYDWAAAWDGSKPYFLYVHTVEPHNPWSGVPRSREPWFTGDDARRRHINDVLPEHRGLITARSNGSIKPEQRPRLDALDAEAPGLVPDALALYDGDVRQANDNFRHLTGILSGRPGWDSTVVVLLADHGDEIYEHGSWFHGQSLYEEMIHVPLVVRIPGLTDAGLRLSQPVSVLDVPPTLAELIGAEPLALWEGSSLLPLLHAARDGRPAPEAPPVYSMRINVDRRSGGERGDLETVLRIGNWKLIVHQDTSRTSLFDLAADPHELHDLSAAEPDRAKSMLQAVGMKLRALPRLDLRASDSGNEADEEKRQHLIELGYIEGNATPK